MRTGAYRMLVLGCALSWFLVGLHAPALHQMTHHGRALPWSVLAAMTVLVCAGIAALARLLRVPRPTRGLT